MHQRYCTSLDQSEDIPCKILQELKETQTGLFSTQLDETTDVTNFAQNHKNGKIEEDVLFCKPLQTSTTATDIFEWIDGFSKNIQWNGRNCVEFDGAPAMQGCKSGFESLVKQVTSKVIGNNCIIHRQVLATKTLPGPLE